MTAPPPSDADDVLSSLLAGRSGSAYHDPHAGHAHSADVSVRPAIPEDAERLARLQVAAWDAAYGDTLPGGALGRVDVAAVAASWRSAITAPPSAAHRVLTAVAGADVVGFAAMAPAATDEPPSDGSEPVRGRVEVVALEVDPAHVREGHGSRLLAACADTARSGGGTRLETWAVRGDEPRTRFLASAGFGPAGLRRTLDVPGATEPVVEVCWFAAL